MKTRPEFILEDPVDCDALSKAYASCGWRWAFKNQRWGKIPSSDEIRDFIKDLQQTAENGTHYCSSGGITVQIVGGSTIISIAYALHQHLPVDIKGHFEEDHRHKEERNVK